MPTSESTNAPGRGSSAWSDTTWFALAALLVALGAYYRVRDFPQLLLLGDEGHALRAAYRNTFAQCFVHYQIGDSGIPLNLYARALLVAGKLDELSIRLPMVASGLVLLCSPLFFVRRLGRPATLAALALFATSPGLTYFTFVARPYALAMCALVLGFLAWDRWYRSGTLGALLAFTTCAGLAVFFHIFSAFAVLGLFLVSLRGAWLGRVRPRALVLAALITGGIVLALLGPGLPNLLATKKAMIGGPAGDGADIRYFVGVWNLLTGQLHSASGVILCALLVGIATWTRREPHVGLSGLALLLLQVGALTVLRPNANSMAYFRWMLPPWPILLLFAGTGVEVLIRGLHIGLTKHTRACVAAAALLAAIHWVPIPGLQPGQPALALLRTLSSPLVSWSALLVVAAALAVWGVRLRAATSAFSVAFAVMFLHMSPIRMYSLRVDSFRTQRDSLNGDRAYERVPAVYSQIAADPSVGDTLLECPNLFHPGTWAPNAVYQQYHGKRVVLVDAEERPHGHYTSHFKNVVALRNAAAIRRTGARYLLLHLDLEYEYRRYGRERLLERNEAEQYRVLAADARAFLRERCGKPIFGGPRFEFYDLRAWLGEP